MKKDFMFTSESVTEGHPDKLCDQISDAIVDHFLQRDPFSRIIAECAVSTSIVFIAARFAPGLNIDFSNIARKVINQIGYAQDSFNSNTCSVLTSLKELSEKDLCYFDERVLTDEEIEKIPAKNQVTVFGFACKQTSAFMPLPIWLSHKIARRLTAVRLQKILPYLSPDCKTQVGIEYRDRKPFRIHSITIVASQNSPSEPNIKKLREDIKEVVIKPVFNDEEIKTDSKTRIFINPDGPYIMGGPALHSGLTGRKNAIDTYGEYSRHSGAALSGKDPMRIDRVGAYAARYAAKNVVAAGLAEECEIQLSYTIGLSRPVSIQVETFNTGIISDEEIAERIKNTFDFRLAGIIKKFNLRYLPSIIKGGFYRKLASYGHVGRMDIGLPWELTDKVDFLKHP
ncbi:MAG: methionine adenosyltransferase [Thermodesulfovibrionales bacterium]|nr:methionine adenosyltransferase [Thermodesulfovibrionales bacterium]